MYQNEGHKKIPLIIKYHSMSKLDCFTILEYVHLKNNHSGMNTHALGSKIRLL